MADKTGGVNGAKQTALDVVCHSQEAIEGSVLFKRSPLKFCLMKIKSS